MGVLILIGIVMRSIFGIQVELLSLQLLVLFIPLYGRTSWC